MPRAPSRTPSVKRRRDGKSSPSRRASNCAPAVLHRFRILPEIHAAWCALARSKDDYVRWKALKTLEAAEAFHRQVADLEPRSDQLGDGAFSLRSREPETA